MHRILAGWCALLFMNISVALAQPSLFSTEKADGPAGRTARNTSFDGTRARSVTADANVLKDADTVDFNLFDDRHLTVRRARTNTDGATTVWTGEIEGAAGSEVTMVIENGRMTGSIRTPQGEFYRVRPEDDGTHTVEQVDAKAVTDDEAVEPPEDLLKEQDKEETKEGEVLKAAAMSSPEALAVAKSTIDLLVVYTAEARIRAGSATAIAGRINLAVAEANQAFLNSGIDIILRLVGTAEAAPSAGQAANSTYLSQVTSNSAIAALRNQYGADVVSVWINGPGSGGGVVGIGWIMTRASTSFQAAAFHVVELNFANGPYYSFPHELGHNLGSAHDRANSSTAGVYSYAYGYQQPQGTTAERFVDIMAYTSGCSGCPRINHFSNPDVYRLGWATGVVATAANSADIRLAFNSTRTFAEQWRATKVTEPAPAPEPTPAPQPTQYAPTVTSVSPTAGTGTSAVLTAAYADGNGAVNIENVHINVQASGSCTVMVKAATGAAYLLNDAASAWTGGVTIGQGGTAANSRCTISGSGSSLTANGNTLTLKLPISFASTFAGTKDVLLKVDDQGGLTSGWQKQGTWTVPAAATAPAPPTFTSLTPAAGSGMSATFTAILTDPNGASQIANTLFLINSSLSTTGGCYVYTITHSRIYYLLAANGSTWYGPANFGGPGLSNGLCTFGSATSLNVSGTSLAVTLPVQFSNGFRGGKYIYIDALELGSPAWIPWVTAGSFNVQ